MNIFILSKDRAAQLDLLLDSIQRNAENLFSQINILYTYSNDEYKNAYKLIENDILRDSRKLLKINLIEQKQSIRDYLINHVANSPDKSTCLCTDDTVFYSKTYCSGTELEQTWLLEQLAFSFRLGLNTIIQNYKDGSRQSPLTEYSTSKVGLDTILTWNWVKRHPLENYGYASGLDAVAYENDTLLKMLYDNKFVSLREFEGKYALDWRNRLYKKPLMSSFQKSVAVNIPANSVLPGLYIGEDCAVSTQELNDKFLDGYRLSLDNTDFNKVVGCHQEIELKWDS